MPNPTLQAFPLTEQQKHVWKTQAPHALSPAIAEIEVNGPLDVPALRGAVETLGRNHEILRTVYHVPPGSEPLQVIQDEAEPWAGGESSHATSGKPVAFRCDVKQGNAGQTRLLLQIPALSADHTSFEILFRQLAAAYEAHLKRENPPVGAFQYADYAQWQADLREQEASLEARRFWTKALAVQPALKLPLEKAVDGEDFVPRTLQFLLAPEARALLAKRAAEWGVSEESLLAGVWGALLGRMTGSPVIPMSVESPGRTYEELDEALGLFDRWLPIGFSPDEKQTLRMAARQVQKLLLESRRHGDGFSSPAQDAARSRPLLFSRRREMEPISVQGITFRLVSIQCPTEPFRVKLECRRLAAGEVMLLSYDSSRISLTEANSVGQRFLRLLAHGLAAPDAPLQSLPCVASQEEQILTQWAWSPPPRRVLPILQRFAESVQSHPRTIAVRCAGETATYEELNERAHRLAHHLRHLGVRGGQPVGLCAERSVDLITGILGILQAGGAYVPLDPGYPRERIDFMVRDAGIQVVVAQPRWLELFDSHQVERVALSQENRQLHQSSTADPEVAIPPDQLAYIIYTSGSTGIPKGVMIRHSSLAISTAARLEYYPDPVQNYLLLSSFSFDSSIAGIFWTLSSGGTLTLPAEGTHQDPLEVLRLVSSTSVTHLLALPSFYQAILERGSSAGLRSLRTVIVAGEACPATLVRKHGQDLPRAALYNEYGPTEATVWSAVHRCLPRDSMHNVPIGRPVPGLGIYILDEHGHHAGLGVAGEIYIAGPTLAESYRNRPDLTAEKFVESPVQPGVRLYRTGDLGRFLENGEIEFLGRIDHQVKIRGYRIELGEIEQLLRDHDAVEEAAVIAREDTPGDKRLVAYVVPRVSDPSLEGQLRQLLSARLPAYMIPASFVLLEKMPLSPNGKLDRKALPAPSRAGRLLGKNQIPAGPEEELLARIWADLLKLERVGRRDNFFELGGHSLLALQMLARVRDTTQVELPLRSVFDRPTLEELALVLTANRGAAPSERRQIRRVPRQAMARDLVEQWEDTAAVPASPTSAT